MIRHVPAYDSSAGAEAIELAELAGVHLFPWQQQVLVDGLGVRDGRWASFENAVNCPRQNGKNEIGLARELAGLFLFNEQLIIHSAHEFTTATEHQRRLEEVIQDTPELHKRVKQRGYRHSHGEESIELRSGQRIRFRTRTKGGGRGHTGDVVVFDEAMILAFAMVGALLPTLSARSILGDPQVWYFFTAVDQLIHQDGLVATRLRERALAGDDESLSYAEWSVDAKDPGAVTEAMARDRKLWAAANPSLGELIAAEHVAKEQRSMPPRTFAVERLGVGDWPDTTLIAARKIDAKLWAALADTKSTIAGRPAFAFDVTPDRSYAAIGAAGRRSDGDAHLEVIDHQRGTRWIPQRLKQLQARHDPVSIVCDGAGPAGSLVSELEAAGLTIDVVKTSEHAQACGMLVDRIEAGTVHHLGTSELRAAVEGAVPRAVGDGMFAWARTSSTVDISPLVVVTLALGALGRAAEDAGPMVAIS